MAETALSIRENPPEKPRFNLWRWMNANLSMPIAFLAMLAAVGQWLLRTDQLETAQKATTISNAQLELSRKEFDAAEARYKATEEQRRIERERDERARFLSILQAMSAGLMNNNEMSARLQDSDILGSMQMELGTQLLMLLMQAELLLPRMQKLNAVTEAEYLVLAEHSLAQHFDGKATEYCELAAKSDNPKIQAEVKMVLGSIAYYHKKLDEATKRFNEALKIYEEAPTLIEDVRAASVIQACADWSELEISFGDYDAAERIIKRGEDTLAVLRPGPLKDSGVKVFDARRKEIEERQAKMK